MGKTSMVAANLVLAVVVAAGCSEPMCPEGSRREGGRCVVVDGGTDAGDDGDAGRDGGGCDAGTWYEDQDEDGHGGSATTMTACMKPGGFAATDDDCDDGDEQVHPGAEERCNGADDDCDETLDEGLEENTFYVDDDGDGHGDPERTQIACEVPDGHSMFADDCDDTDGEVHPDASERCNDADDDCDGVSDEGLQGPLGPPVAVTTDDSATQSGGTPVVAMGDGYVTVFGGSGGTLYYVHLGPDGSARGGGVMPIAPDSSRTQRAPALARIADSRVVVVWSESVGTSDEPDIVRARVLDFAGSHGSPVTVDGDAHGRSPAPAVAVAGDRVVVVWLEDSDELFARTYATDLSDPGSVEDLNLFPEEHVLTRIEGSPPYVVLTYRKQRSGDMRTRVYADRMQLSPPRLETNSILVDDIEPARRIAAASMSRSDGRPLVAVAIMSDFTGRRQLVRIAPGEFGSPMEVEGRTTTEGVGASSVEIAASAAAGLVDMAGSGSSEGTFRTQWFGLSREGELLNDATFGANEVLAQSVGAARLDASSAGVTFINRNLWFQPIGCESE